MPRQSLIQYRRDTSEQWAKANPVLADGEVGFDRSTGELRVGDGSARWLDLEPIGGDAEATREAAERAEAAALESSDALAESKAARDEATSARGDAVDAAKTSTDAAAVAVPAATNAAVSASAAAGSKDSAAASASSAAGSEVAAVAAAVRAEAVPVTNDGIMAQAAADPDSQFSGQVGLRISEIMSGYSPNPFRIVIGTSRAGIDPSEPVIFLSPVAPSIGGDGALEGDFWELTS